MAARTDGVLYSWGLNSSYQLGDGTATQRTSPVLIPTIGDVVGTGAGPTQAFARNSRGALFAWGSNASGQLGIAKQAFSAVGINLISNPSDTDADGLPDSWENYTWSTLANTGIADFDADSLSNIQEWSIGTDPRNPDIDGDNLTDPVDPHPYDYYNGVTPTLQVLSGDGQSALVGTINPTPFDVAVWDGSGTEPLEDAPVSFAIASGNGRLTATGDGQSPDVMALETRTDPDGTTQAWYRQPGVAGVTGEVQVTAGSAQVSISSTSLPPSNEDSDGDGLTNAQEYSLGTNPSLFDTDGDGIGDGAEVSTGLNPLAADADQLPYHVSGLRMFLKADTGITIDGNGRVTQWADQSGLGNHATQTSGSAPTLAANAINGRPVVRFASQYLQLPATFMASAGAGEAFVVARNSAPAGTASSLWQMSSYYQTWMGDYYNVTHYPNGAGRIIEKFGSTSLRDIGLPYVSLSNPHLYNVLSGPNRWEARLNGHLQYAAGSNGVDFSSTAWLGRGQNTMIGDIAEVLVFDRILSDDERDVVAAYLTSRYALRAAPTAAPTGLEAKAVGAAQIVLTWNAPTGEIEHVAYDIERKAAGGAFARIATTRACSFLDGTVSAGQSYTYRVRARTSAGPTALTNEATVQLTEIGSAVPTTGVRLWLRADEPAASEQGGQVVAWPDTSAARNFAVRSGSSGITTNPTGLNGRPSIQFSGGYFSLPGQFMSGVQGGEAFVVARSTTPSGTRGGLWQMSSYYTNGLGDLYNVTEYPSNTGVIIEKFGSSTLRDIRKPAVPITDGHLYNVLSTTGRWEARFNGYTQYETTSNSVDFSNAPWLGRGWSTFNGQIAEVIIYDRVLSSAEREAVGRYLTRKYSLQVPVGTPGAPTALAANATQAVVSWAAPSSSRVGIVYELERRTAGGGSFSQVTETEAVSFLDSGLNPGDTYEYRVRARTYAGTSGYTTVALVALPSNGSPLVTAPLRLWLKADDGVSLDLDGSVSMWADRSGRGNHAIRPNGSGPTWATNAINGRPAVRFQDQYLNLVNATMSGASSGEGFVVARSSVAAGTRNGLWQVATYTIGNLGDYYGVTGYPSNNGAQIIERFGSNGTYYLGAPPVALATPHLYSVLSAPDRWEVRFNKGLFYRSQQNSVNFSMTAWIGRGEVSFTGDIAEVMLFDRLLTEDERDSVGDYLAAKYGLSVAPRRPMTLSAQPDGLGQVQLSWEQVATATSYTVERRVDGGTFAVLGTTAATTLLDTDPSATAIIEYRVRAVNAIGTSEASAVALVDAADARDTNGNGFSDLMDLRLGYDPADLDIDDDGIGNAAEIAAGLDPHTADSDRDGVSDGLDVYPLDPSRSAPPPPDPGDQSGPIITLEAPAGATLL